MLKKMMIVAALTAVSALAVAGESDARQEAKQVVDLRDGSTLYVFQSGKMALENKYGRAISTKPGTILTARDGHEIKMIGNEVAHLDSLLNEGMGS